MSFGVVIVKQLTPTFGQTRAREIAAVAEAIAVVIAESPLACLEDHQTLSGLAALFGMTLQKARESKRDRDLRIAAGGKDWPCLTDPDGCLEIMRLTDAPDPVPDDMPVPTMPVEELIQRILRQDTAPDFDFDDELDSEVKGH